MRGVLSGWVGGFLCQLELFNHQLTSSEAACVYEQVAKADCKCPLYIFFRKEMNEYEAI